MNDDVIKKNIEVEIDKIIYKNWSFLDNGYNKISKKYYHRTELKNIAGIKDIKIKF